MVKTVKIFLSSSFRDMHVERDALIKNVFPKIQEEAKKLGLRIFFVNLCCNDTKEQLKQDKAEECCLDAMEESCPYFLGILEKRYDSAIEREINYVLENRAPVFLRRLDQLLDSGREKIDGEEIQYIQRHYQCQNGEIYQLIPDINKEEQEKLCLVLSKLNPTLGKFHTFFFFRADVGEAHDDLNKDSIAQEDLENLKQRIISSNEVIAIEDYFCQREEENLSKGLEKFEEMVFHHLWSHISYSYGKIRPLQGKEKKRTKPEVTIPVVDLF